MDYYSIENIRVHCRRNTHTYSHPHYVSGQDFALHVYGCFWNLFFLSLPNYYAKHDAFSFSIALDIVFKVFDIKRNNRGKYYVHKNVDSKS